MWGLGFGFERLGIGALRYPLVASFLLIATVLVNLYHLPSIKFDGNITAVLPQSSSAIKNYNEQKDKFRDFSRDIVVVVRSPRLLTASGMEDLRFLQLELAITEGVSNVLTAFSLPDPDPITGDLGEYFPEEFSSDIQVKQLVSDLLKSRPQARSFISEQESAALMFVNLDVSLHASSELDVYLSFQALKKAVEENAPKDFEVFYSGLTPIGLTVISALISDQLRLTIVGMLLGAGIAFAVFRSLMAALICAIPPAITAICTLGSFSLFGVSINYLNTVLPTLALILAFADTIVMYYKWNRLNIDGGTSRFDEFVDHIKQAVARVGPATALTSITTALAFYSFSYSANEALASFAYLGVAAVSIAFLSVIVGLPLAIYWSAKLGWVRVPKPTTTSITGIGSLAYGICRSMPILVSGCAIVAVCLLYLVHISIKPEYKVTDYLPYNSESREAETVVNNVFGGRSMIFLNVPVAHNGGLAAPENRARLNDIEIKLAPIFGSDKLASLNSLWREFKTEEAIQKIAKALDEAEPERRRGYMSKDADAMLLSVRIPSDQSISKTLEDINTIKTAIKSLPYAAEIKVTGFPVLMAEEFTRLIEALRTSLLIAIALGILVIAVATRSPILAIAAVTPNLLPILSVELVIYLSGGVINLSEVIALTIAFGIGIDNAVHVINVYARKNNNSLAPIARVKETLLEIGPALAASSLIICVACLVTLISTMPVVPILGQLIIATLVVALIANLIILPANIITLERIAGKFLK